jgi:hypothetical protein
MDTANERKNTEKIPKLEMQKNVYFATTDSAIAQGTPESPEYVK